MRAPIVSAVLLLSGALLEAGPSNLIDDARARIASGDCAGAAQSLQAEVGRVGAVADLVERDSLLAALHFYSGVAYSNCGNEGKARAELKEFFRLHPGQSTLDPNKFDARFLRLFKSVHDPVSHATFDRFYPGSHLVAVSGRTPSLLLWGASSEFQLFATERERDRWERLGNDLERSEFIDSFWRSREGLLETGEHQFRRDVTQRIRFADRTFPSPDERGALTDRGRVFVLLGAPARVYRQALQRGQTTFVKGGERRPLEGQVERWIYFKPQLPEAVPAQQVEFRFITQPGYGEGVLQKEFMALKALEQAQKASTPHAE